MNQLQTIINAYPEEEFLLADGFDDAVIGVEIPSMRIVYSVDKVIDTLVNRDEMSLVDAAEHFEYNIRGAYVGEKTPIWVDSF